MIVVISKDGSVVCNNLTTPFSLFSHEPQKMNPPPFSVEQTRPDYEGEMGLAFMINQRDEDGTTDDDDDDYVFVKGPER